MIAPYWEDLSPQRANSGKVWQWYDTAQHRLIVEYNHIEQYLPTGSFETFQVILLDPAFYQTSTGDGRIIFQYKDMSAAAQSEGTMGIENYAETIGLQYFFDGTYDIHAHNITNQMAVLYTTPLTGPSLAVTLTPYNTPIVIPPGGGNFSYNLLIANIGTTAANFDGWLEVDLPTGNTISPLVLREGLNLNPGVLITRDLSQSIPGSAPAGLYTYRCCAGNYPGTVYAFDEFEFTKSGVDATSSNTDWTLSGWDDELTGLASSVIPDEYYLEQNVPNPFNPVTMVNFGLPEGGNAELKVFDLLGREVEILYSGWLSAGHHQITFDACYLPSGIYFYQLKVGDFNCVKKMLLIK
jgi:hypothetical protein